MSFDRAAVEALYEKHCAGRTATAIHLPRLRRLAAGLETVVEFGTKRGASATALLLDAERVISYDIVETPQARALERIAGDRWRYRIEDTRKADVPRCDLLFVDSLHTYAQVRAEIEMHAGKVGRYLVFHDTVTFGVIGANGETGAHLWTYETGVSVPQWALGIRPAIDELLIRDPSWRVVESYHDSHGLLVLGRA